MLKKLLTLVIGFGIAMGIAACHEEGKDVKPGTTDTTTTTKDTKATDKKGDEVVVESVSVTEEGNAKKSDEDKQN